MGHLRCYREVTVSDRDIKWEAVQWRRTEQLSASDHREPQKGGRGARPESLEEREGNIPSREKKRTDVCSVTGLASQPLSSDLEHQQNQVHADCTILETGQRVCSICVVYTTTC